MKTIFVLAAVLALAGYTQAAKVKLAAGVNGDKSITYTIGTSQLTVLSTYASLFTALPSIISSTLASAVGAGKTGLTIDTSLNDDGSLTLGIGEQAVDIPAALVDQVRNVLVFIYTTISTAAQKKNIAGLY